MAIITEIRRKLPLRSRQEPEAIANLGTDTVFQISVEDIIPNRAQPRTAFNQNAIARLADSIRRYGILQPLTVRKVMLPLTAPSLDVQPPVMYELIAGERRLRAAKLAELTTVPCIIINTDDATSAELAIIENLLRENLNMFEQAEAFYRLIHEFHLTQEEAARRVCMSQSAVANKLRILRLLPEAELERLFCRAADVGLGIELNADDMRFTDAEADTVLRPLRIAKSCGCKFYLGSDAHKPRELDRAGELFERAITRLDLRESDKFHISR